MGTKPTDVTPLVDTDTDFIKSARKRRRHTMGQLTRKVEEMVLNDDHVWEDEGSGRNTGAHRCQSSTAATQWQEAIGSAPQQSPE